MSETAPFAEGTAGDGPSSHETCGDDPAGEVRVTYVEKGATA